MMSKILYRLSFIVHYDHHAIVFSLIVLCLWAFSPNIQAQDTIKSLDAVEVSAQRRPQTMQTAAPTQVLDALQLEQQGALQLSDAVKQMAGVTLKDYGGVGGMKTVSARGLGSQFSTLVIDGVAVSDAQNGQVDLGRYLLGNAAYVSFSQGQQQEHLLSARAYAAGNVLSMETAEPEFLIGERTNLTLGMEMGSFGLLNPTALWEQKWSKRLKSNLWVNYLTSQGNYPFTLYYTASRDDSCSRERRAHSATRMLTADANIFYTLGKDNTLTTKIHYLNGHHQLPGPVQFYRQQISAQSTHEEVGFVQSKWLMERKQWSTQVLGKLQTSTDIFEDSAANTLTRYQMNSYRQREAYLSGSGVWIARRWMEMEAAVDGSIADLHSNLAQRNDVTRNHLTAVMALRLHHSDSAMNRVELNANLLCNWIQDRVDDLDTMPSYHRLSPYVGLQMTLHGHTTLRLFYKQTFRAPNFSELYFFTLPRDLRPECAHQYNIGITHSSTHWATTLDLYHNHVDDKIIAIPTQNMFLWSMQNIGKVEVTGADATFNLQLSTFNFQLNYSYQYAVDRTDPDDPVYSKTYGHQIAYTPRHSGGATLRWENRWMNIGANAMVVGERYYRLQNSDESRLPAYCDLGLSTDREFELGNSTLRLQIQVMNLADVQYEVVRSYPMMGRNYRLKIVYLF